MDTVVEHHCTGFHGFVDIRVKSKERLRATFVPAVILKDGKGQRPSGRGVGVGGNSLLALAGILVRWQESNHKSITYWIYGWADSHGNGYGAARVPCSVPCAGSRFAIQGPRRCFVQAGRFHALLHSREIGRCWAGLGPCRPVLGMMTFLSV